MPTDSSTEPFPSPRERRERNRAQVSAAILDAAREVMRERGVAALSLREVARRVGMRAPSLYEYFPSKAALYDALFLMAIRRFQATVYPLWQRQDTFWERLRATFEGYMTFAKEHPDLYELAFERPVPEFIPSEASMVESAAALAIFQQDFVDAIESGRIVPGVSASQAGDLAIAMMHGLTSQHMANESQAPLGSGRYGSLVQPALALFRASWEPRDPAAPGTASVAAGPGRASSTEGGCETARESE